ncbi:MAG: YIP1 family protein [Firmicutes bacterium]|nr:YIP1 family protein [Bacillota bacterium]
MFKESLDDFYDILFNYRKGLSRIMQERNIWNGLVVYLFVNLIVMLAIINSTFILEQDILFSSRLSTLLPPEALTDVLRFMPLANILVQLVFGPLYFLLVVGVINLAAELFGGQGGASKLGAVVGYGHYPYLIMALGGLFTRYTDFNVIGLLTFIALLWSLFLKIAGLKIVHEFSWGRAVLIYFMPIIAIMAAIFIFLLLAIVFLFPLIVQLTENLQPFFM